MSQQKEKTSNNSKRKISSSEDEQTPSKRQKDDETVESLQSRNTKLIAKLKQQETFMKELEEKVDNSIIMKIFESFSKKEKEYDDDMEKKRLQNELEAKEATHVNAIEIMKEEIIKTKEQELEKNYQCPTCMETFINPVSTNCGHTYCWLCLAQWKNTSEGTCPECRRNVTHETKVFVIEKSISDIIDQLGDEKKLEWTQRVADRVAQEARFKRTLPSTVATAHVRQVATAGVGRGGHGQALGGVGGQQRHRQVDKGGVGGQAVVRRLVPADVHRPQPTAPAHGHGNDLGGAVEQQRQRQVDNVGGGGQVLRAAVARRRARAVDNEARRQQQILQQLVGHSSSKEVIEELAINNDYTFEVKSDILFHLKKKPLTVNIHRSTNRVTIQPHGRYDKINNCNIEGLQRLLATINSDSN